MLVKLRDAAHERLGLQRMTIRFEFGNLLGAQISFIVKEMADSLWLHSEGFRRVVKLSWELSPRGNCKLIDCAFDVVAGETLARRGEVGLSEDLINRFASAIILFAIRVDREIWVLYPVLSSHVLHDSLRSLQFRRQFVGALLFMVLGASEPDQVSLLLGLSSLLLLGGVLEDSHLLAVRPSKRVSAVLPLLLLRVVTLEG